MPVLHCQADRKYVMLGGYVVWLALAYKAFLHGVVPEEKKKKVHF